MFYYPNYKDFYCAFRISVKSNKKKDKKLLWDKIFNVLII